VLEVGKLLRLRAGCLEGEESGTIDGEMLGEMLGLSEGIDVIVLTKT